MFKRFVDLREADLRKDLPYYESKGLVLELIEEIKHYTHVDPSTTISEIIRTYMNRDHDTHNLPIYFYNGLYDIELVIPKANCYDEGYQEIDLKVVGLTITKYDDLVVKCIDEDGNDDYWCLEL